MTLSGGLTPTHLRVNDMVDPVGAPPVPYFGWHLASPAANERQTGCQVLVASSPSILNNNEGDLWDSGYMTGRSQNHILYAGQPLAGAAHCFWKVRAWNRHGNPGPYSEPSSFITGLHAHVDWHGAFWIRRDTDEPDDYTYYRKRISLPGTPIAQALILVSAVHKYELYLNELLIGKGPAYHYPQYQYYNAYDVTRALAAQNILAVQTHWFGAGQGRPESARGLIAKLVIEFVDGERFSIGSDASWQQRRAGGWISGTLPRNDEGVGYIEAIDAADLMTGWAELAHDDSGWEAATVIGPHPTPPWTGTLQPDLTRIVESRVAPVSVADHGNHRYVIDLGRITAGRPEIKFAGGPAGQRIAMQAGYTLAPNGLIDPATTQNTDMSYTAIGSGRPFTFLPQEYLGMRYFQIDNGTGHLNVQDVSFIERYHVLNESRSSFTSSNETLNRVWGLMKRSVYLGAQEQFLDTPTREKGGFLVDTVNESLAAMAAFGERTLTRRTLTEFIQSMTHYWTSESDSGRMNAVYPNGDGPRDIPDFTQMFLVWVWAYYLQTGDKDFLEAHYAQLKRIAGYCHRHTHPHTGLIHNLTGGSGPYQHGIVDWPPSMRYGYDMGVEARTVVNALAYADYEVTAKIAGVLGRTNDCEYYTGLALALKSSINQHLLNDEGVYVDGLNSDGRQSLHVSQHANMLPLALGVVPDSHRPAVLQAVKDRKMSVGMVTVGWLVRALGESNEGEHLLDLYTRPDWDGWANTLTKGATCTWESWDADKGNGLSLSHPWGAIGLGGIQEYVLGVKPLTPQYETAQIKPLSFGGRLTHASGRVLTERGDIEVDWAQAPDRFRITVALPVNIQAAVYMPGRDGDSITLGEIGSGQHTFERSL
jgi:alpha-L-rhamnosidase